MKKTITLKRISVFIASPGDTADARDIVRQAIDRINRLVARERGFLLESIGWENIPPGRGESSQEVINPYVDDAHVFIGILHQRFGTPTGIAESGTYEEFLRINKRWENESVKPEIMIYFKKVEENRCLDPGPQLTKVLEFKERIRKENFYHEFEDNKTLREEIENAFLIGFINKKIKLSSHHP